MICINKPFDISTMRTAVAGALERRSLGSEVRMNGEKLRHQPTRKSSTTR